MKYDYAVRFINFNYTIDFKDFDSALAYMKKGGFIETALEDKDGKILATYNSFSGLKKTKKSADIII